MEFDKLPEDMQDGIIALKHGSATIEADVLDALDEAENLKDFQERVKAAMAALKEEIEAVFKMFF